jgi:hypothetical protein
MNHLTATDREYIFIARALVDSLMKESTLLREQADALWDVDPDGADALDRQEVSLRLEAALIERDITTIETGAGTASGFAERRRIGEVWTPTTPTAPPSSTFSPASLPPPLPPISRQP